MTEYPWYTVVEDDTLEQGDILHGVRLFFPPDNLEYDAGGALVDEALYFDWMELNVIVMTQSCDLAQGGEKVPEVLLCGLWSFDELQGVKHFQSDRGKEDARRGNMPGFHLIAACVEPGFGSDIQVVDFRRVYTAPVGYIRTRAADAGPRLRLLPPYREHLSQAFARFFMRVGLPVDIPPFK